MNLPLANQIITKINVVSCSVEDRIEYAKAEGYLEGWGAHNTDAQTATNLAFDIREAAVQMIMSIIGYPGAERTLVEKQLDELTASITRSRK